MKLAIKINVPLLGLQIKVPTLCLSITYKNISNSIETYYKELIKTSRGEAIERKILW